MESGEESTTPMPQLSPMALSVPLPRIRVSAAAVLSASAAPLSGGDPSTTAAKKDGVLHGMRSLVDVVDGLVVAIRAGDAAARRDAQSVPAAPCGE